MKTLIVYFSHSGNNASLAHHLQKKLGCDDEEIIEKKKRSGLTILLDVIFNRGTKILESRALLDTYDLVILISPVWNEKIATPMQAFIKREKNNIRNYAFITLCGGQQGQLEKLKEQLFDLSHQEPLIVTELTVNELLPPEQRHKVRFTTPYRVKEGDYRTFEPYIRKFTDAIIDFEDMNTPVAHIAK